MKLIINTLVFESDVKSGASQLSLIDRIKKLGADGIEVRREYFSDIDSEAPKIASAANKNHLLVNYSVPDVIFLEDGSINPKLDQYFQEAVALGVDKIKFNIGHFDKFAGDLKKALEKFTTSTIQMNIENDQSRLSGTSKNILQFLNATRTARINNLDYVYDLRNWAFVGENASDAAASLHGFIDYVHLKNVIQTNSGFATSDDLNSGLYDWKAMVDQLPQNVEYALEYPMSSDEIISDQMRMVRNAARSSVEK